MSQSRARARAQALAEWKCHAPRVGIAATDEGVRGDRPPAAELPIGLRQHCTLVKPAALQDEPDLGKTAADIAHRAVEVGGPRQHVSEAPVGERQCVGVGLAQAQSEAPRYSLAASEIKAGGCAVDR